VLPARLHDWQLAGVWDLIHFALLDWRARDHRIDWSRGWLAHSLGGASREQNPESLTTTALVGLGGHPKPAINRHLKTGN
jgi:hypothetical protein